MFLRTGKKTICSLIILTFLLAGVFDTSAIHSVSAASVAVVNTSNLAAKAAQIYTKYYGNLNFKQKTALDDVIRNIELRYKMDPVGYISSAYLSLVSNKSEPDSLVALAAWGVKKQPGSVTLLNNLGVALSSVKNFKDAIVMLEAAQLTEASSLETIVNLGNAYLDDNRDKDAKAQYDKALKLDDKCQGAWEGLYAYYMKKKDLKSAMGVLPKIAPVGFISGGANKMQKDLDKETESKKLEAVKKSDSIDTSNQKIMKMVEEKPITLAPVVEDISPEMAAKIRAEMENLKVKVEVPANPFLFNYSNVEQYYIYETAYSGRTATSETTNAMNVDPSTLEMAKKLEGMSEEEIKAMADEYVKGIQDTLSKYQGMLSNPEQALQSDPAQLMKAVKDIQLATGKDMFAKLQPKGSTLKTLQQLGLQEKKGIVTSTNYNNFVRHKLDYSTHFQNIIKKFEDYREKMKERFQKEMAALLEKQAKQTHKDESVLKQEMAQRNKLRQQYLEEFGSYATSFYSKYVKAAIEKVENSQALYVKNMGSRQLKKMEGEQMKAELNTFLNYFAKAEAPIDNYEVYGNEAQKQLEEKISAVKKQADKKDEPLPTLKNYEDKQKSLLEKIYEDTKFDGTCGLAKVTYENAEITLSLSDPISNKYMDFGASLKDLSVSLTEGEGIEVGFKVAQKGGKEGDAVQASIGYSDKGVGKKTTLYFDDNFNVADATQTTVPGSNGFSSAVSVFDLGVEGSMKIETTAEGTSSFLSGIKASYKDIQLLDKQYKEQIAP